MSQDYKLDQCENSFDQFVRNPVDDAVDKTTPWQLTTENINHPVRCRQVTINASDVGDKVH